MMHVSIVIALFAADGRCVASPLLPPKSERLCAITAMGLSGAGVGAVSLTLLLGEQLASAVAHGSPWKSQMEGCFPIRVSCFQLSGAVGCVH
jgi:hypothetical protein